MSGAESITAVAGPMGHSVQDLELFFQIVSDAEPWLKEPLLAMKWQSQIQVMDKAKLTVGVMLSDKVVTPHPYITRVLAEVAQKLIQAGHDGNGQT